LLTKSVRPADGTRVSVNDLALAQGIKDTRRTLADWQRDPLAVVGVWLGWSFLIALALLGSVYVIAVNTAPDYLSPIKLPGLHQPAEAMDFLHLLYRNGLVLALHAMACVAGFIAGSSLPVSAESRTGVSRWVHEKAGPLAIAFVVGATAFSLVTQAYVLGSAASTLAWQGGVDPAALLAVVSVHALPELVALFLPLAAWLVASRRRRWDELLAATVATTLLAVPVVLLAAHVEIFVWPHLLQAASPLA
jgi:hypothetical protein